MSNLIDRINFTVRLYILTKYFPRIITIYLAKMYMCIFLWLDTEAIIKLVAGSPDSYIQELFSTVSIRFSSEQLYSVNLPTPPPPPPTNRNILVEIQICQPKR